VKAGGTKKRTRPPKNLPIDSVVSYLNQAIIQYENWLSVRDQGDVFVIDALGATEILKHYLPAPAVGPGGKRVTTDELFTAFMHDARVNFLVLFGDHGVGKTAVMLYWFYRVARQFLTSPREGVRIPFFLDLSRIPQPLSIEKTLGDTFFNAFAVRYSPLEIQDMLLRGSLMLFLDGFDAMASTESFQVQRALESVSRLALRNVLIENQQERRFPANKVVLAVRRHHVQSNVGLADDILESNLTRPFKVIFHKETHRFVRLFFPEMDEGMLKAFIIRAAEDGIAARNLIGILQDQERVDLLSETGLIKEMMLRSLARCKGQREINVAGIYRAYVDLWVEEKSWRFKLSPEMKRRLLHQMAYRMMEDGDNFHIHFSELAQANGDFLAMATVPDLDPFQEDLASCPFVTRDGEGNYGFIHPSFLNFFFAEYYFLQIKARAPRPAPANQLSETIRVFLKQIVASQKADLGGADLSALDLSETNLYQAQMGKAVLRKSNLSRAVMVSGNLSEADLTGANLRMAKLTRVHFKDADITGADFGHANLREADLRAARFNGASFRGADLRGAKLQGARLAWVDLQGADLSGANLTGVILTDADLSGADLTGAVLNEADLTGANLSRCILKRAEMTHADVTGADLTGVDFSGANLTYSKLERANLSMANLEKARFREANMIRINLDDALCTKTDFRWSQLYRAKARECKFREADFSGADLREVRFNEAVFTWANFTDANLENADLSDARMNMAKFRNAILRRANLSGSDLTWADLTHADLSHADLIGTNLSEADLSYARLTGVDLNTVMMDGANFRGTDLKNAHYKDQDMGAVNLSDADLKE